MGCGGGAGVQPAVNSPTRSDDCGAGESAPDLRLNDSRFLRSRHF